MQKLPIRTVQEYMGHANISTTMVYSHYAPAGDEAGLLGQAFKGSASPLGVNPRRAVGLAGSKWQSCRSQGPRD